MFLVNTLFTVLKIAQKIKKIIYFVQYNEKKTVRKSR